MTWFISGVSAFYNLAHYYLAKMVQLKRITFNICARNLSNNVIVEGDWNLSLSDFTDPTVSNTARYRVLIVRDHSKGTIYECGFVCKVYLTISKYNVKIEIIVNDTVPSSSTYKTLHWSGGCCLSSEKILRGLFIGASAKCNNPHLAFVIFGDILTSIHLAATVSRVLMNVVRNYT